MNRIDPVRCSILISLGGAGCAPMGVSPPPAGSGVGGLLRVGVQVDRPEVVVVTTGRTTLVTGAGTRFTLKRGDRATITASGGEVQVREWGGRNGRTIDLRPQGRNGTITIDGVVYRGGARVIAGADGVTAVNLVSLEEYLPSVVGAEMGDRASTDQAAVAAQAVAARTYALKNRGKHESAGFDLRADAGDQVYRGVPSENDGAWAAVRTTVGRVITYEGELIPAFFHSTCGPRTASPSEVFRSVTDVPYLAPVSDEKPGGGYYNDISPYFQWEVEWTGDALRTTLGQTVPAVIGVDAEMVRHISNVYVHRRGPSGRAVEVRLVVPSGEIPIFGPDIRSVFLDSNGARLRTNAVEFVIERRDGVIDRLVATGWGFGHGVGLCQWGAIGRARAGQDYRSIIEAYYPGVSIERWN